MGDLKISDQQYQYFQAAAMTEFTAFMLRHLKEHPWPGAPRRSDEQWRAFIRAGVGRARAYGARTDLALGQYIDLMVMLGEDFDRGDPAWSWTLDILKNQSASADARIDYLMQIAVDYYQSLPDDPASGPEVRR